MSRKSWGRGFLDILRGLGVKIDRRTEETIIQEREATPETSTADIVQRLSLAPPEVIQRAVIIAKEEGSPELLGERFVQAQVSTRETRRATMELGQVAAAIAKK